MAKQKKLISKVVILVLGVGLVLVYAGYKLHKAYKDIEVAKKKYGYKTPCESLPTPVFNKGNWTGVLIDADITYTDGAHNIVPYDFDSDGRIELIANSYRSDALMFYKFEGNPRNSLNWSRYVIDSTVGGGIPRRPIIQFVKSKLKEKLLGGFTGGAHFTAIADMNIDGRDDLVVAGDLKRYDVVWYEAPEDITKVSEWKKHIVYINDSHRTYHVETGDIDGDGDQDIVFATKTDSSVGWLENTGSEEIWPACLIDDNCASCFNVRAVDIDKDGKDEIIASQDGSQNGGKLHLYKYSGNPLIRESWKRYDIAVFPVGHGVSVFEIVDMDRDGNLDIATCNHQGDVYLLKNPYPHEVRTLWKKCKITSIALGSGHSFREIDVGDIDNDGDNDIIVADEGQNMIIWFQNPGMDFSENWVHHIVDKSDQYLKWCHSVELGDLDDDGDLDVAVSAAGGNTFFIYFNDMKKNTFDKLVLE